MKVRNWLVVVLAVVVISLQVAACSQPFEACEESRSCAAGAGGLAGDGSLGGDATQGGDAGEGGNATGGAANGGASGDDTGNGGAPTDDSGGMGGAITITDPDDGTAIGTIGQPCRTEGAYACAGHAQRGQLVCAAGKWAGNGTCASGSNCDSAPGANVGACAPILSGCSKPGDAFCKTTSVEECGVDLVTLHETACGSATPVCLGGACVACTPSALQCSDASHTETCSASGAWQTATACAGGFCNGAGVCGVCKAGSKQCTAGGPETCSASGVWSVPTACTPAAPVCNTTSFTCTARPSCTGLAATCGPASSGDCCASSVVPVGSFYRSYDGVTANYTSTAYPATVSGFRLDTYEITVGRFRKFVAAYSQNMTAAGAGKDPNNAADTGWAAAWNSKLSADAASLKVDLFCGGGTWTNAPGNAVAESLPINCLDWYQAEAFCIWDGGRLPTEAEWNYAASGGSEQRMFPWGNTSPGASASIAVYNCYFGSLSGTCTGDSANIAPVGAAPAGNGKWGQADLAGNVTEWVADGYGAYPTPCTDCAGTSLTIGRVQRGGSFQGDVTTIVSSVRDTQAPDYTYIAFGARCARLP